MPLAAIIRDRWPPIKIIVSDHVDDARRSNSSRNSFLLDLIEKNKS
jgi:hypothetical protein